MFFMLRSLICIGVVYALASSDRALPPLAQAGLASSQATSPSDPPGRRPRFAETTKVLVQQGADALGAVVRNHCQASPEQCLATLRRLNGSRIP